MPDNNQSQNNSEPNDFLNPFFGFSDFLEEYCQAVKEVLNSEGAKEKAEVLDVVRRAIRTQSEALTEIVQEIHQIQDEEGRRYIERFVASSGAKEMIANGRDLLMDTSLQKRSLVCWILIILEAIKNLIAMLGNLFPQLRKLLELIYAILEILDKLIKFIALLLGEECAEVANLADKVFWTTLERYLNTTAALKRNLGVSAACQCS